MRRRAFLAGVATHAALAGCSKREHGTANAGAPPMPATLPLAAVDAAPLPDAEADSKSLRGQVRMETWIFDGGGRAVVLVPAWLTPGERYPLLFALHGRGEANKGPEQGVMGWPRDYALVRAMKRLCAPPLTPPDLEGFVDPKRLGDHNKVLASVTFRGLVVVCPYSPDVDLRKPAELRTYGDYLVRKVLPRAQKELPVLPAPASTGIDGVSLGGAIALRTGLAHAELFGAVGSLQAAIGEDQVSDFADLAKSGRAKNPRVSLRLLTSSEDYFRGAITHTSGAWRAAGVAHDFADVPGPHDYPFNRGPGAIEMLLWHDRVLARSSS